LVRTTPLPVIIRRPVPGVNSISSFSVDLAPPAASFSPTRRSSDLLGFGLPVVNFVRNGLAIAQARATSGSGTTLTVPYPTNATSIGGPRPGLSAGSVTVEVYNQTGSGSFSLVGTTPLTVNDTRGMTVTRKQDEGIRGNKVSFEKGSLI